MPTMGVPETDPITQLSLPPGFRFHPTDEELLVQYLCRKVAEDHFPIQIIGEIDLYKFDPWDLPSRALFGEKEWYFFSPRDRKYPNGSRPNRVAGSGYWKATGTDKIITSDGRKVGIKKALVFYVGKAPKGTKTNWIMHEYRLLENHRKNGSTKLDDWVLCRIYKKNSSSQKPAMANFPSKLEHSSNNGESSSSSSQLDDVMLESFPQLDDRFFSLPRMNSLKTNQNDVKTEFPSFGSGNFDWGSFAGSEFGSGVQTQARSQVIPGPGPGYVPSSIPPVGQVDFSVNRGRNAVEEEVQSGVNTRGGDNSGFFQQDQGVLTQNFSNSVDPFGFRYPTQTGGFGYRQ